VDAGRAELAILIAPVTVEDFVAVNLQRRRLPRKSTWFTPKARAGLVLAQLDPARPDPAEPDPARVDPARVEPAQVEPAQVEPARVEPAQRD
jgi:hypothetical protein